MPPPVARRPNWAGRLVAALVVVALIVVAVVVASHGSGSPAASSKTTTTKAVTPIKFQNASVFHLERDADGADKAGLAIDGNPDTSWPTDTYYNRTFAGLRHGLGLALTLNSAQTLHTLNVASSTTGWSAEVYVADAIPDPPSLAPWGPPVDSKQNINGSTTFNLQGHKGSAVLIWITDLGATSQTNIAEVTAT